MFVVRDSGFSASFAEVCYNGDPYGTIVSETRGEKTKVLHAEDPRWDGRFILYTGHDGD